MNIRLSVVFVCLMTFLCGQQSALAQYAPGSCHPVPTAPTCIDSVPCKTDASGTVVCLSNAIVKPKWSVVVPQTCWQYSYPYSCQAEDTNDCASQPWWNSNTCQQVGSACQSKTSETGACSSYLLTYSCQTSAAVKGTTLSCNGTTFNTSSFTPSPIKNQNFGKAATAAEIARQIQTYSQCDQASGTCATALFAGIGEHCTKGYFGLKNCCKATGGAQSNSAAMSIGVQLSSKVVMYAGEKAVDAASPYVFDAMYSGGEFTAGLAQSALSLSSVTGTAVASDIGPSVIAGGTSLGAGGISAMGFTYGATGSAAASGGMLGGDLILSGSAAGGDLLLFNPYAFAAAVAIAIATKYIQQLLACTDAEKQLGMHMGANLSVYTGETCSNKIPILNICLEYTDTYCSFNSVLAKLINRQGGSQIGRNPQDCSGLTIADIGKLDFTKIDLTEFTNTMVQQAISNVPTNISGNYQSVMQNTNKGSSQTTGTGTAYPTGYTQP